MNYEQRLHILDRHLKVKEQWEQSGFAKEYPDLYEDLKLKIKSIEKITYRKENKKAYDYINNIENEESFINIKSFIENFQK